MGFRFITAASVAALCAGSVQAETVLHILHTNDLHSRIEPVNAYDSTCDEETKAAGECFGGVARIATKVKELRDKITAEGGNVLVLDAGDQYQGSLFYSTYKGKEVAEFMTAIGYDAMALGNHEFDDGPNGAVILADGVEFPIISGNLDLSQSNELNGKIDDTLTLEVGGEKIGIVSTLALDTPETATPGPNVIFMDDIESLKGDVQKLTDEGVNKIIALTHVGYKRDLEYAAEIPGIDIVLGGHSHTLLGDMEGAEGPYPTMVKNPDGTQVPVAQAYAYSKYLGHLILTFDDAGVLTKVEGEPILLDNSVPEDEAIAARITELAKPINALRDKIVGELPAAIDAARENCRAKECEMGNVVADAMLDRVKNQGITIAIANSGGLRASIDKGQLTMGEIISVLPFQNTLSTFQLKGADVVAALENGASQYEEVAGRFAQVAGLKYTVDPAAEPGNRISDVLVLSDGEWQPIDPEETYGVVSNNYLRAGGDGYAVFETNGQNAYDFGPDLAEVLGDYLVAQGEGFAPELDGRIIVK